MVKNKKQHPADMPKNKGKRRPDYLKCEWASEQSRIFARLLDSKGRVMEAGKHRW
jgi:hypothetical protein